MPAGGESSCCTKCSRAAVGSRSSICARLDRIASRGLDAISRLIDCRVQPASAHAQEMTELPCRECPVHFRPHPTDASVPRADRERATCKAFFTARFSIVSCPMTRSHSAPRSSADTTPGAGRAHAALLVLLTPAAQRRLIDPPRAAEWSTACPKKSRHGFLPR